MDTNPPHAPRPAEQRVASVEPVRGDGRRRGGNQPGRERRRPAFDALMEEIAALPGLAEADRERLRRNLHDFLRRYRDQGGDAAPPADMAPGDTVPGDTVLGAIAPEPGHGAGIDPDEARQLREELRRCLEAHNEGARRIAAYLHLLIAQGHEAHVVELSV
ncbi:MAG TPA: hypothetical protein VEB20_05970 [Azospirillaceae bacterium]|nr:hypothetical protein [Azospirillaceae bacterium]